MNNSEILAKVTGIKETISRSQKEIEIIQTGCIHPEKEKTIVPNYTHGEKVPLIIVCGICKKPLGIPSKEETEKYLES